MARVCELTAVGTARTAVRYRTSRCAGNARVPAGLALLAVHAAAALGLHEEEDQRHEEEDEVTAKVHEKEVRGRVSL